MNTATLQSQTYSYRIIAQILGTTLDRNDSVSIDAWWIGLRVSIKRSVNSVVEKAKKGLSTILSWKKVFDAIWDDSWVKAQQVTVTPCSQDVYMVSSRTKEKQSHKVVARATGLSCTCIKYATIRDHIKGNVGLMNAYKTSKQWSNKGASTPFCHHIIAVCLEAYACTNLADYVQAYTCGQLSVKQFAWPNDEWQDEEMPYGSEKQSAWAVQLRDKFLQSVRIQHCEARGETVQIAGEIQTLGWLNSQEELNSLIVASRRATAKFWINSRKEGDRAISAMLMG